MQMAEITVREQILSALADAGEPLGPKELEERTGAKYSTIQSELLRLTPREVRKVGRGLYALAPGGNIANASESVPAVPAASAEMSEIVHVPLVSVRPSAGDGEIPFTTEVERYLSYDRTQMRRELGVDPSRLVLMTVTGTSMMPTLLPGERVLVFTHHNGEPLHDAAVYVWKHQYNGVVIKRTRWKKDGTLILESDNRDDPRDFVIAPGEEHEWKIVGRVVRVEKNL